MTVFIYAAAILIAGFLVGLRLMQHPRTARNGNRLSALCMALAILITIHELALWRSRPVWALIAAGSILGIFLGHKIKMIQMPQLVALLNGFGGAASAAVAGTALAISVNPGTLVISTAAVTLAVGSLTLSGSLVAALKLNGSISQKATLIKGHNTWMNLIPAAGCLIIVLQFFFPLLFLFPVALLFAAYGVFMALRIGGADMPIIISFLNSMSGIAAAVCGFAVFNVLLTGTGALVGVAGLILTNMMCKAMNRNLRAVLGGFQVEAHLCREEKKEEQPGELRPPQEKEDLPAIIQKAQTVILVPGYGMAVSQAQQQVKNLIDALEKAGKSVKIAIHPVAGRMPGHMNVLLAEVGIPYEMLYDMDAVNPEFADANLVVVVGACDVINPAANTAEGTPIYGMPILKVEQARHIVICNLDEKPGYSGVDNTLYSKANVFTAWGDAAETVTRLTAYLDEQS